MLNPDSKSIEALDKIIASISPETRAKELKQKIEAEELVNNEVCLWHKDSQPNKHTEFGHMFKCVDCMKEIERGRCIIDVCNFDLDMTYYFRSFWSKVEIKGIDECWPWKGGLRHKKQETVAYMPSPFHSAKTQSAARVAFWLARGYTGKLRITHKEGCSYTCCNPLHLRIMGVELLNEPKKIELINFNLGNIHDHARSCSFQKK